MPVTDVKPKVLFNFTTPIGNTNTYEAVSTIADNIYSDVGVTDGFFVQASTPASSNIRITYSSLLEHDEGVIGKAVISYNGQMISLTLKNDVPAVLSVASNANASARFDLVCIVADFTAKVCWVEVIQGGIGADPDLTTLETATLKYLPIARIQKAFGGDVTNGEIMMTGTLTYNSAKLVRPKSSNYGSSKFAILNQSQIDAVSSQKGDAVFNDSLKAVGFHDGLRFNYVLSAALLFELLAKKTIFTGSGTSAGNIGTFANAITTSDGVAGSTLTIPANSLIPGQKLTIYHTVEVVRSTNISSYNATVFNTFKFTSGAVTPVVTNLVTDRGLRLVATGTGGVDITTTNVIKLDIQVVKIGASGRLYIEVTDSGRYNASSIQGQDPVSSADIGHNHLAPSTLSKRGLIPIDTTVSQALGVDLVVAGSGGLTTFNIAFIDFFLVKN